jgi:hypothetical protein
MSALEKLADSRSAQSDVLLVPEAVLPVSKFCCSLPTLGEEETMDLMSLAQLLGNFGEFVGAIAVVVTLGYLALQIRHSKVALEANTQSVQAQIAQARADNLAASYRVLMDSPHLPEIMAKRFESVDDEVWAAALSPEEKMRVRYYCLLQFNDVRNQYYQYQQGLLDESIWETSTRGQIARMLEIHHLFVPGNVGNPLDPGFKKVLDEIARERGFPTLNDGFTSSREAFTR